VLVNRNVIEDTINGIPHFRNQLLAIEPDEKAADRLIDGAIWVLSRDPSQGAQHSPHSPLWYFEIIGPPRCILYYTFDVIEVLLISIQRR
jgi:hypothetical protein